MMIIGLSRLEAGFVQSASTNRILEFSCAIVHWLMATSRTQSKRLQDRFDFYSSFYTHFAFSPIKAVRYPSRSNLGSSGSDMTVLHQVSAEKLNDSTILTTPVSCFDGIEIPAFESAIESGTVGPRRRLSSSHRRKPEFMNVDSPCPPFVMLSAGMFFFLNSAFACVINDSCCRNSCSTWALCLFASRDDW